MFRYLSLEWIEAQTAEVAASAAMQDASTGARFGVTQVVTDGPEGEVTPPLGIASLPAPIPSCLGPVRR